ncbi:MAG: hypothetical protein P857_881 [Candidatus Xenolissoclinum pacificiensis L6]|uniref:Uncharacterized protein n=1 Tax=Candidatus Xenolissoclinum pacificiensis L6 TaxID=1401685 RepID=W2V0G1_9RICK|nr:MAG: hypothetical protein P857_881 [Candidatus Xenolissoclinum pacificiensis L6]
MLKNTQKSAESCGYTCENSCDAVLGTKSVTNETLIYETSTLSHGVCRDEACVTAFYVGPHIEPVEFEITQDMKGRVIVEVDQDTCAFYVYGIHDVNLHSPVISICADINDAGDLADALSSPEDQNITTREDILCLSSQQPNSTTKTSIDTTSIPVGSTLFREVTSSGTTIQGALTTSVHDTTHKKTTSSGTTIQGALTTSVHDTTHKKTTSSGTTMQGALTTSVHDTTHKKTTSSDTTTQENTPSSDSTTINDLTSDITQPGFSLAITQGDITSFTREISTMDVKGTSDSMYISANNNLPDTSASIERISTSTPLSNKSATMLLSAHAILGIVFGLGVVLVLLGGAYCYMSYQKYQQRRYTNADGSHPTQEDIAIELNNFRGDEGNCFQQRDQVTYLVGEIPGVRCLNPEDRSVFFSAVDDEDDIFNSKWARSTNLKPKQTGSNTDNSGTSKEASSKKKNFKKFLNNITPQLSSDGLSSMEKLRMTDIECLNPEDRSVFFSTGDDEDDIFNSKWARSTNLKPKQTGSNTDNSGTSKEASSKITNSTKFVNNINAQLSSNRLSSSKKGFVNVLFNDVSINLSDDKKMDLRKPF